MTKRLFLAVALLGCLLMLATGAFGNTVSTGLQKTGTCDVTCKVVTGSGYVLSGGSLGAFSLVVSSGTGTAALTSVTSVASGTFNRYLAEQGLSLRMDVSRVLPPVPESGSIALYGSGLLGLAGIARRRILKSRS